MQEELEGLYLALAGVSVAGWDDVKGHWAKSYTYPFFPRETTKFSLRFISHRFVSLIRLLVLGRTYGTYLHYERSYV